MVLKNKQYAQICFLKYNELHNFVIYFHNLKFDGEFILYYLMKNDYEYVETKEKREDGFYAG